MSVSVEQFEQFNQFDQLRRRPWFMPETRRRVAEIGLAGAAAEVLTEANIHIAVEGDTSTWQHPGQPVLAIGDHSQGIESSLILDPLNTIGRGDVSVVAKPYSLTGQIVTAVSVHPNDHLISVIPSGMARGRTGGDAIMRLNRTLFRRYLPDVAAVKAGNNKALNTAASALADGGRAVVLFPTGGVYNAATTPWRTGVGQVAARLSAEAFNETQIVPFMFSGFSPRRIMQAVAATRVGLRNGRQDIAVRFGKAETLGAIFGGTRPSAPEITDVLYQRYRDEFYTA